MIPERERQILAHLYGRNNGKTTALPGHWATDGDGPDLAGCWMVMSACKCVGEYWPAANELVIHRDEAIALSARKLIVLNGTQVGTSAQGRDHWRRMGCPT